MRFREYLSNLGQSAATQAENALKIDSMYWNSQRENLFWKILFLLCFAAAVVYLGAAAFVVQIFSNR